MGYGATLTGSAMTSSLLKVAEIYPDSIGGSDQITFAYNRQQQTTQIADQGGTVHAYFYDKLGRRTQDRVIAFGTDVDTTVKRIETTYDERGLISHITSWNNATVGSGSVLNEVATMYNDFGQAIQTFQAHDGEVDPLSTPSIQMAYADGTDNTIRQTALIYPNGRELTYDYGDGIDNAAGRVRSIIDDDTTHLVDYEYLGERTFVTATSPEPSIQWTLASNSDDLDTGDIYAGLDRFGRTKDNRWRHVDADLDRIKYGYDRNSNCIWRQHPVAIENGVFLDECYIYDGIYRLSGMERGLLNNNCTAITTAVFRELWTLDATDNWSQFKQAVTGGDWTTSQTRTSTSSNQISEILTSVGSEWYAPSYSLNGNMTTMPQPNNLTDGYRVVYDAWNRMCWIHDVSTGSILLHNSYDGRGFRIVESQWEGESISSTCNNFFSDLWQLLEQRFDNANITLQQQIPGRRRIDDYIACEQRSDGPATRLYLLQDIDWSVVANVDTSGEVTGRVSYTPFGDPAWMGADFEPAESPQQTSILFTGRPVIAKTGLYDFRQRVLHSALGVFITRDILSYPDGLNLYAAYFVPFGTDPFGLQKEMIPPEGIEGYIPPTCDGKCNCEKLKSRLGAVTVKSGTHTCEINFACGTCGGFPASASVDKKSPPPPADVKIEVCLNKKGAVVSDLNKMILHEFVHAKQFCGSYSGPEAPRDVNFNGCPRCQMLEREAHEFSCALSFEKDTAEYTQCVECGVAASCSACKPAELGPEGKRKQPRLAKPGEPGGRLREPTGGCSWAKLGMESPNDLPKFPLLPKAPKM